MLQLGPILIHALVYHFPKVFYGRDVVHSDLQTYVVLPFVLLVICSALTRSVGSCTSSCWCTLRNARWRLCSTSFSRPPVVSSRICFSELVELGNASVRVLRLRAKDELGQYAEMLQIRVSVMGGGD